MADVNPNMSTVRVSELGIAEEVKDDDRVLLTQAEGEDRATVTARMDAVYEGAANSAPVINKIHEIAERPATRSGPPKAVIIGKGINVNEGGVISAVGVNLIPGGDDLTNSNCTVGKGNQYNLPAGLKSFFVGQNSAGTYNDATRDVDFTELSVPNAMYIPFLDDVVLDQTKEISDFDPLNKKDTTNIEFLIQNFEGMVAEQRETLYDKLLYRREVLLSRPNVICDSAGLKWNSNFDGTVGTVFLGVLKSRTTLPSGDSFYDNVTVTFQVRSNQGSLSESRIYSATLELGSSSYQSMQNENGETFGRIRITQGNPDVYTESRLEQVREWKKLGLEWEQIAPLSYKGVTFARQSFVEWSGSTSNVPSWFIDGSSRIVSVKMEYGLSFSGFTYESATRYLTDSIRSHSYIAASDVIKDMMYHSKETSDLFQGVSDEDLNDMFELVYARLWDFSFNQQLNEATSTWIKDWDFEEDEWGRDGSLSIPEVSRSNEGLDDEIRFLDEPVSGSSREVGDLIYWKHNGNWQFVGPFLCLKYGAEPKFRSIINKKYDCVPAHELMMTPFANRDKTTEYDHKTQGVAYYTQKSDITKPVTSFVKEGLGDSGSGNLVPFAENFEVAYRSFTYFYNKDGSSVDTLNYNTIKDQRKYYSREAFPYPDRIDDPSYLHPEAGWFPAGWPVADGVPAESIRYFKLNPASTSSGEPSDTHVFKNVYDVGEYTSGVYTALSPYFKHLPRMTAYAKNCLKLKPATQNTLGGVKAGDGVTIDSDGTISAIGGSIDDTSVSTETTWSSNKVSTELSSKQGTLTAGTNITIDANNVISASGGGGGDVELSKTVSGSICSFSDGADGIPVKDLVAQVVAVQSGSGDPSPNNVRPISGRSSVGVTRTGKNLFDGSTVATTHASNWGVTWANNILTIEHKTAYTTGLPVCPLLLPVGNYVFSYVGDSGNVSLRKNGAFDKTLNNGTTFSIESGNTYEIAFSAPNNTTKTYSSIMVEVGNSVSTYIPPETPTTVTIALGQTVYGAELGATRGAMMITHGSKLFSDLSFTKHNQYANTYYADISDIKAGVATVLVNGICSAYKVVTRGSQTNQASANMYSISATNAAGGRVFVLDDSYSTLEDFVAGTANYQLIYELVTPVTVQLTPTEIQTLLGINNIWADTGDTTVTYYTSSSEDVIDLVQYDTTKQDKLTAGTGISIDSNNVISATGGGGGASIDDTTTALDKTWSSSKVSTELSSKQATISVSGPWLHLNGTTLSCDAIDDDVVETLTAGNTNVTLSSQVIDSDSLLFFFCSDGNVYPTHRSIVETDPGADVTLFFDAQQSDIQVRMVVMHGMVSS